MCLSRIKTHSIFVGLSLLDSYHHSIPTRGRAHHLSVDGWTKHVWLFCHSQTWVIPQCRPEHEPRYEQTDTLYLFRFFPESILIHPGGSNTSNHTDLPISPRFNNHLTTGTTVALACVRKSFHSKMNTFRIVTEKPGGSAHPKKLIWE